MSQDPRGITNNELLIGKVFAKGFTKQEEYLSKNRPILFAQPAKVRSDLKKIQENDTNGTLVLKSEPDGIPNNELLDEFWVNMGVYETIVASYPQIAKTTTIGYTASYRKQKNKLEALSIPFDGTVGVEYQTLYGDLQLSNFQGSISRTTKETILKTIDAGLIERVSVDEMSKRINALSPDLFSKNRAKLIATTEVGKAYEYGNYLPMKEAQRQGANVEKRWNTVGDSRVRPSHSDAENEGRKPMDYIFNSVGQGFSPEGIRCRCTNDYRIK